MEDNRRYFIVTPGRTGSSLLCACLADAGAEFGMDAPDAWNPMGGEMEHPLLGALERRLAATRTQGAWKPGGPTKYLWARARSRVRQTLRHLLAQVAFVKATPRAAGFAQQLGYDPRIILNVRPFTEVAASHYKSHPTRMTYEFMRDNYRSIMMEGLFALEAFGGCVVEFSDIADRNRTEWASRLAAVTGLDANLILSARNRRANGTAYNRKPPVDGEMDALYAAVTRPQTR